MTANNQKQCPLFEVAESSRQNADLFEHYWYIEHAQNPDMFPLTLPFNNAGVFDEQMQSFDAHSHFGVSEFHRYQLVLTHHHGRSVTLISFYLSCAIPNDQAHQRLIDAVSDWEGVSEAGSGDELSLDRVFAHHKDPRFVELINEHGIYALSVKEPVIIK